MTGEPEGSFYVSRKVSQAAGGDLTQHQCRLIRVRGRWVGQLRRILHEARDNCENGILHGFQRHTVLRPREPVGIGEALKDAMAAFDASVVGVAVGSDNVATLADAE